MTALKATTLALATLSALAASGRSAAATFDFESVAPPPFTGTAVPDGYAGATWSGFVLRRTTEFTGGSNGFVLNGTTMALATELAPSIRFATPTVFTAGFVGSNSVTGPSTISYQLFLGNTLVASSPVLGFQAGPLASVYGGAIDRIVFQVAASDRLTLDDLVLASPVPAPPAWAALLAGLVGVGAAVRRRAPGAGR